MPISLTGLEQRRAGVLAGLSAATLQDKLPATFPHNVWTAQQARYDRYWRLYTGEVWNEVDPNKVDKNGNPLLRFPLQINYARTICLLHASALWGQVRDSSSLLAPYRVLPRRQPGKENVSPAARRRADELQVFLNNVWEENDARSILQEGGLIQQFLGGIVYRVSWTPDDPMLRNQIRIEMVIPDFFLPIWNTARPSELLECFVIYRLPIREAQIRYGYAGKGTAPLYVEHWTRESVSITLDGTPVKMEVDGETITYQDVPNPFGVVPFVYIPRERAGDYYGVSLVADLEGIMRELNARMANIGDMLLDYATREVFIRNVSNVPRTQQIGLPRPAINLGLTPPGSNHAPEVIPLDPPAPPPGVFDFPKELMKQLLRDASVPAVAFGEDEGSQRSALTLSYRMFPLLNCIRAVRRYWTVGFRQIAWIILRIAITKGLGGLTDKHWEQCEVDTEWSPIEVRDDEGMLQTAIAGVQNWFMSPKRAMQYLSLTEDVEQEYYDILEHQRLVSELRNKLEMQDEESLNSEGAQNEREYDSRTDADGQRRLD